MSRRSLFRGARARICLPMRASLCLAFGCSVLFALPALAQQKAPVRPAPARVVASAPKAVGHFDDWTAATNIEAGQKACYAFTRVKSSAPELPGRGEVILTVTQRSTGRDAVALSAGFEYAPNAAVVVMADQTKLDFYTSKRSAFARDGHVAVASFRTSRQALAHSPGPKGVDITDTFSLRGFERAYAAINKECPAK